MIALLRQAVDPGEGEGCRWAQMRTHRILTDKLDEFGASSKLNAEGPFLQLLKEEGRVAADEFSRAHGEDLGTAIHRRSRHSRSGVLTISGSEPTDLLLGSAAF